MPVASEAVLKHALSARLCKKSSSTHLSTIRLTLHAGDVATSHAVVAQGVVMDENSESPLAIAFFYVDAMPTVILNDVVGYLDALSSLEQDADKAFKV